MPEISVILLFYNAQDTLEASIDSILKKSYSAFKPLLIDNNSNEKSVDITKKSAQKDRKVIILQEPEQGIVPALHKESHYSSGKYICRMDAEDIPTSDRFKLQYHYL